MKVGTDAMLLGSIAGFANARYALDIGAGTGVISLMLAQRFPELKIHALEIDPQSAQDCRENFFESPWSDRLSVEVGDFLAWETDQRFDLIVSNPPFYVNSLNNSDLVKAQSRHEVFLPFVDLMRKASASLLEPGELWLIVPFSSAEYVKELAAENGLFLKIDCSVNGVPERPVRAIICFVKGICPEPIQRSVTIRDHFGNYTEQYKELTAEFHDRQV